MQSLVQARGQSTSLGEPIRSPIQGLHDNGVLIRKGQLCMVAAGPGSGKSMLVQAIVHNGDGKEKNTALYLSADSDASVMHERAGALSTDLDQDTIREMVAEGNTAMIDAAIKAKHSHVTYSFRSSPSEDYIIDELTAYVELHGRFPEVLVVDNLKDMADDDDADEFRALDDATTFLNSLAKSAGLAVIALHHVVGHMEDNQAPIPLSGVRGKINKTATVILTLYRPSSETMRISVVKNRGGMSDSSGNFWVPLEVDAGKMRFRG